MISRIQKGSEKVHLRVQRICSKIIALTIRRWTFDGSYSNMSQGGCFKLLGRARGATVTSPRPHAHLEDMYNFP